MHQLYMAKLGVQLADAQAEQQQGRATRKDRVSRQQAIAKFENLKAQAKKIRDEKFVDRVEKETYTEKIPKKYNINNYTRNKWYNKPSYVRDRYLQNASRNNYRGDWAMDTLTKTRDKVIPFTLEDVEGTSDNSYKDIYDTLSPDLKKFFDTPDVVLKNKATRISTTKETVANKLIDTDRRIAEVRAKYQEKIRKREESWSNKSSSYRNKENSKGERYRRQNHKDRINDYEDDMNEKIAELQGFKKGLGKASGGLSQNQDLNYADIEKYAWDVGNYEERKERNRNDNRNNFYDQARSGELDEQFKKLGLDKNKPNYYHYKSGVKDYNKNVTIQQNLIRKGERIGFDKLSKAEQIKVNPDLAQWQWENKGEKLLFKGNEAIGVESSALQQSISIPNYQKVISPEYLKQQHYKKFARQPTFNELIKKQSIAPVNPFGNFKKDPNAIDLNIKTLTAGKELPYDYGHQGTSQVDAMGNFVTPTAFMDKTEYNKIKNTPSTPIKDVIGGVVAGYGYVNDRIHWDFSVGGSPSMPKLQIIKFGKGDTKAEDIMKGGTRYLDDVNKNIDIKNAGQGNIDALDLNLETKYSAQYQNEFEREYGIALIDGETDFDTASETFANSTQAQGVQTRYQTEYNKEYEKLLGVGTGIKEGAFWLKKVPYGVAGFGVDTAKLVTKAVETPLNLATTGVAVYTGVGVLKAIPPVAMNTALFGLGTYGTVKFLDPSSTSREAGAGLVTAGLSFGTLGYAGVRHLKAPNVKVIKIKAPKMNLKVAGNIKLGRDYSIVKDGVTGANKIVYKAQKLSQIGRAGSRTQVTTNWRTYINKFNKQVGISARAKPIYRGVPTQQLGYTRDYGFFRSTTKSGYDQATKLLTKYGWTDAQAKSTLRYTAPRVYEQYLNKGVINVNTQGGKATAYFEHLTKRPVISVDKGLGIKTRGGADFKTITKSTRQLVKDIQTKQIYAKYSNQQATGFVNKKGNFKDWKSYEWTSGKTFSKASKTQKGFEYLGKQNGIEAWDSKTLFKDMIGVSKDNAFSLKITNARGKAPYKIDINLDPTKAKPQISNQRLYQKIIDLDKGKNVWVKPTNIKKTPFSTTFGKTDKVDDVARVIYKQPKSSNVVKEIMAKIDKVDDFSGTASQSKYYGKSGGFNFGDENYGALMHDQLTLQATPHLTQQQVLQNQHLLKTISDPQLKVGVMNKLAFKNDFKVLNLIKMDTLTATVGLKSLMKNDLMLKNNVKLDVLLKNNLKYDQLTQVKTVTAIKTAPLLKTQLKGMLDFDVGVPSLADPVFKQPKIPKIDYTPLPKPFVSPYLKDSINKKRKGKGKNRIGELSYMPDFTSRSLGLKAETVTQKQAQKKLKKLLTGLEIRRGVKVKR